MKPELYWKRFDCRSANQFGIPVVAFSGTLRCATDERSIPVNDAPETAPDESKSAPAAAGENAPEASDTAASAAAADGGNGGTE